VTGGRERRDQGQGCRDETKSHNPQGKKIPLTSPFCKVGKRGIFSGQRLVNSLYSRLDAALKVIVEPIRE
jgi:hypothetical protein